MAEKNRTIIIGGGVAGSAIAFELNQRGLPVTLLCRSSSEGSSFTNQKWNHSGLLYPDRDLAYKASQEFIQQSLLKRFAYQVEASARFLAVDHQTINEREQMWQNWDVGTWGLEWRRLNEVEYRAIGDLGDTRAIGGFAVPDRIIDFPKLIAHLRNEIVKHGAEVVPDATVKKLILDGGRVVAVEYSNGNKLITLDCTVCILAAGAWSNSILQNSGIPNLDLIHRKCVVLEYEKELVPGITTCLDVWRHDNTRQDVTLIPFQGRTLAAGTGFTKVSDGDENIADAVEIERLYYQLVQCFPNLPKFKHRVITCIKTEKSPGGKANVSPQIYGSNIHMARGLIVAIPGKASFMFNLATSVADMVNALVPNS